LRHFSFAARGASPHLDHRRKEQIAMNIRLATAAALVLGLALVPAVRAGDDTKKGDSKESSSDMMTIHGIISGVTVEGETIVDPKAKRAVEVDAAFLTVVGMPAHHHASDKAKDEKGNVHASGDSSAHRGHHRANVYMVWLSPKTKVCSCCDDSGKETAKKECGMDKLEIGDHVEITFSRRDESVGRSGSPVSDSMKTRHGRHRIYSVNAQEITILPPAPMHGDHGSSHESKDNKGNSQK
jgi:hypothetical protein